MLLWALLATGCGSDVTEPVPGPVQEFTLPANHVRAEGDSGFPARVCKRLQTSRCGLMSRDGTWLVSYEDARIRDESEGKVWVDRRNPAGATLHYELWDLKTSTMVKGPAGLKRHPTPVHEGLSAACTTEGCGYLGVDGTWALEPKYARTWSFHEGRARAASDDAKVYGYIDRTGAFFIEPAFRVVSDPGDGAYPSRYDFSEGHALAQPAHTEKWRYGYVDMKGEWVVEPQYFQGKRVVDGAAVVQLKYFGESLTVAVPPKAEDG